MRAARGFDGGEMVDFTSRPTYREPVHRDRRPPRAESLATRDRAIIDLAREGWGLKDLARAFGMTPKQVIRRLQIYGCEDLLRG